MDGRSLNKRLDKNGDAMCRAPVIFNQLDPVYRNDALLFLVTFIWIVDINTNQQSFDDFLFEPLLLLLVDSTDAVNSSDEAMVTIAKSDRKEAKVIEPFSF